MTEPAISESTVPDGGSTGRDPAIDDRPAAGVSRGEHALAWFGPLAVTAVAGVLRFTQIGHPHGLSFDEAYYVRDAWSLLQHGVELATRTDIDSVREWNAGSTDVYRRVAGFAAHPPAGKWAIALGESIFGPTSRLGWRFSSALVGTLSVLITGRIAWRLFGSAMIATLASALLALDGLHLVMSRTGMLDIFVMFWALCGFACLVIDRDELRRRLPLLATGSLSPAHRRQLRLRPWRLLAAVSLGLCISTKWSGLFFLAVFGLLTVCWDVSARREAARGTSRASLFARAAAQAAATMTPVALLTYLYTWAGWFITPRGFNRLWADDHPATGAARFVPDAFRSLWSYHTAMWEVGTKLTAPHLFESPAWQWFLLWRPTRFARQPVAPGSGGPSCAAAPCEEAVIALGTPTIWWFGALALVVLVVVWLRRRDWRAGALLLAVAAGYLPWFLWPQRTIFFFYAVAFVPYVCLALAFVASLLLRAGAPGSGRRRAGGLAVGTFLVVTVAAFLWWLPVWTGSPTPTPVVDTRLLLPTWR